MHSKAVETDVGDPLASCAERPGDPSRRRNCSSSLESWTYVCGLTEVDLMVHIWLGLSRRGVYA